MNLQRIAVKVGTVAAIATLSACAGTGLMINSPQVTLTNIEIVSADFDAQTFLLGFDVNNPNAFPLPVRSVRYRVRLGDHQFASGETQGNFTVPSKGNGKFSISVQLDLLKTTSNISTLIQSGLSRDMDYELSGSFLVDIPFAKPLNFENGGKIEMQAAAF